MLFTSHYLDVVMMMHAIFQTEHRSNRFETSELVLKIKEDIQHIANIIGIVELVTNNFINFMNVES